MGIETPQEPAGEAVGVQDYKTAGKLVFCLITLRVSSST